jgi:hypothetical protein
MPGIAVDIDTQLLIDKVVKGSKLDASVDDLLEDINKKAKRKGISPIDEKTFMGNIKVLEREFERISKKVTAGGISGNSINDAVKQYERIEIASEEIRKRFLKRHIELTEAQSRALAKRLIDYEDGIRQTLRKARAAEQESNSRNLAKMDSSRQSAVQKGDWSSLDIDTMETGGKPSMKEIAPKGEGMLGDIGGIGGSLGKLAAVGTLVVAAGIALEKVMEAMVKESKILNTVMNFFNKTMGLLMDLILLPLLPILIWAMLGLVKAVLGFNSWWNSVWNTIKKEGLFGLIDLSLKWLLDTLYAWADGLLNWLFSDKPLNKKIELPIFITLDAASAIWGWFLDGIFGKGTTENLKRLIQLQIDVFLGTIGLMASMLYDWITGKGVSEENLKKIIELAIQVDKMVGEFKDLLIRLVGEDNVRWWYFNIEALLKDPGAWIWKWIELILSGNPSLSAQFDVAERTVGNIIKWLYETWYNGGHLFFDVVGTLKNIGQFALGGMVPGEIGSPQLIIAHGGEEVIPVGGRKTGGQGSGSQMTNNVFNFYGLTDSQLQDKIRSTLRQDATRYAQ